MGFLRIDEAQILNRMRNIRERGELSPVRFGFHTWNQWDKGKYLMGSRKTTLLIGGEPNHGKSQIAYELTMQLMEKHSFKVALFATETGDVEKIFSLFCHMYIGKPYAKLRSDGKVNSFSMTDDEAAIAEAFLLDKLYVFKQDRKDSSYQTLDNIYAKIAETERIHDIKFDTLVIDPVYDVDDFEPNANEVLRVLNRFNLEAEENNRYDIMVNHVSETAKFMGKNGKRVKLEALADEFYGGKNNQRKAMMMILTHRPEPNDDVEAGEIVEENRTNIKILKIKPEGMAKWGTYPLFYDWRSRRYYEMFDEDGTFYSQFAGCVRFFDRKPNQEININEHRLTPQQAFTNEQDNDDFPF